MAGTAQAAVHQVSTNGTLTIGETQTIQDLNPFHLLIYNYPYNNQLFEPLVRLSNTLQPEAVLAKNWKQANGGKALILYLRKGVHFANGDLMTSADVAFSLKYAQDAANGALIVGLAEQVTAVQTPNPYEVVLRWAAPNPAPFDLLNELYVLDAKQGANAATSGNGTGAFRVQSYQPGEEVTMVRRNDYWGPRATLANIIVKVFPSEQTEIEALRSGSINAIYDLSAAGYASLRGGDRACTIRAWRSSLA